MENFLNNLDWNKVIPAILLGGTALLSFKFIFKNNNSQNIKSGKDSFNVQTKGDIIIGGSKNDKQ